MLYTGFEEDKRLVQVVPSARQIAYENMEFFCFIHFTVNTFTGSEWGDGTEPESIFNPTELDARQWAKTAAEGGMKGLILTCKHHDGFCLWPSKYTEHSIKNSPYKNGKGDIVRETAEACREFGLKFGVYLSPWDRNNSSYGKGKEYDDYYLNQLTELLTEYGDIFVIWLDGACGEGPNGKVQKYDWQRYYKVMRELQPNAVISISGPDIRWCGNEAGEVRPSEWSVVAKDMTDPAITAALSQQEDNEEFRNRPLDETQTDLKDWFDRAYVQQFNIDYDDNSGKALIQKSISYMEEHYQENLSLKDISRIIGLSGSYFSYLFKQQTGKNYIEYLNEIRLEEAMKDLKNSDEKIVVIAQKHGFQNLEYFSRYFKKKTGESPARWRKTNQ